MFSFLFKKNKKVEIPESSKIWTDMHSHVLPGLDDGADSIEDSVNIMKRLVALGYKRAVLTPHIMSDAYKNTPNTIEEKLNELKPIALELGLRIEAAAEYYVDEGFHEKIISGEKILSFGERKYVLVETSYINESSYLTHTCFELQSKGYIPVLAHPERYTYMYQQFHKFEDLIDRGILFQLNINSLIGYYSPTAQKIAEKLIDKSWVHFIGTDCHSVKHTFATEKAMLTKYYEKVLSLPLLNNSI